MVARDVANRGGAVFHGSEMTTMRDDVCDGNDGDDFDDTEVVVAMDFEGDDDVLGDVEEKVSDGIVEYDPWVVDDGDNNIKEAVGIADEVDLIPFVVVCAGTVIVTIEV